MQAVKIYYALPAQHCVPSASIQNGMAAVTNGQNIANGPERALHHAARAPLPRLQ